MSKGFLVGGRFVGHSPALIVAEAGVNHNGDPALAHRLVDAAANVGADAVKFQTFRAELVAAASAKKAGYQVNNTGTAESQVEMLRALELPVAVYRALQTHATDRGLIFLSTPFDAGSADLLDSLGVPAFKVASGELTNHPFLASLAARGKPILLSTGMATHAEVADALGAIEGAGAPPVALFHCVSNYPAAPASCNLRAMETMRAAFSVPTGWSDHTEGTAVSVAAAALGADLIEKHLTLDRTLPGPDHTASLGPGEFAEMVRAIRVAELALGTGQKEPAAAELAVAAVARRSLYAARDLPGGHIVAPEDLVALRPGTGIPPSALASVEGRPLRVSVAAGEMLLEEFLDGVT